MVDSTAYNRLLNDVCVGFGFCGGVREDKPCHVDDFIPNDGEVTVDQFIQWLFRGEGDGYPTDYDVRCSPHYDGLKRLFVKHMGSDKVDASKLKWDL
ncbi:hypothetical protein [Qipengyuania sp. DGS5-3]|uniref:hypothetical protein n=1 Tax=Qipengyuania sp. DGS5-3 TaxID=3349632 RepID=UPI0036D273FD